jgi:hypothetical protein
MGFDVGQRENSKAYTFEGGVSTVTVGWQARQRGLRRGRGGVADMPEPHLVCESSPTSKTSFSRCWPLARKRADLQAHFWLDWWVEVVTTAVQLALALRSDRQAVEVVSAR